MNNLGLKEYCYPYTEDKMPLIIKIIDESNKTIPQVCPYLKSYLEQKLNNVICGQPYTNSMYKGSNETLVIKP